MEVVLVQEKKLLKAKEESEFGRKIGLLGLLFGCWHQNLSRPFTSNKLSYIVCLDCGARKHFNPETLETFGAFYYPPKVFNVGGEFSGDCW